MSEEAAWNISVPKCRGSQLAARSSMLLVRAKFLLDCCTVVVIFVVFATAIVGNSNKRTTNVVGVAGMAEMAERLQMGDRGLAEACQGNAFKPFSFSFTFTFTFTFSFPLKQITQKMSFCRKHKASRPLAL